MLGNKIIFAFIEIASLAYQRLWQGFVLERIESSVLMCWLLVEKVKRQGR